MICCDLECGKCVKHIIGLKRERSTELTPSSFVSFNKEVTVENNSHESMSLSRSGKFAGIFTSFFDAAALPAGAFAPFAPF